MTTLILSGNAVAELSQKLAAAPWPAGHVWARIVAGRIRTQVPRRGRSGGTVSCGSSGGDGDLRPARRSRLADRDAGSVVSRTTPKGSGLFSGERGGCPAGTGGGGILWPSSDGGRCPSRGGWPVRWCGMSGGGDAPPPAAVGRAGGGPGGIPDGIPPGRSPGGGTPIEPAGPALAGPAPGGDCAARGTPGSVGPPLVGPFDSITGGIPPLGGGRPFGALSVGCRLAARVPGGGEVLAGAGGGPPGAGPGGGMGREPGGPPACAGGGTPGPGDTAPLPT